MTQVATTPAAEATIGTSSATRLNRLLRLRELGIAVALVILVVITTVVQPRFLSAQSVRDILFGASIAGLLAIGQAVVIITRNIDLSVGSVLGLAAFGTARLLESNPGLPVVLGLLAGLALGAVCGLVNALIVRYGNVPSLVVTLGTLYVFRGVDYFWAQGDQVNAADLPAGFLGFGNGTVLGIPYLALLTVLVMLAVGYYLRSYRSGRELYALGSSPEAARLAGVKVGQRLLFAFLLSGALAGLGGALYAARFGTVDAAAGTGFELTVIAAVVVGGVAVFGGSGSVYGAVLGALLLTTIGSSLAVLNINQFWQQAVVGALILLAIGVDRLVSVRAAAALKKRSTHVH
jgi:rhamnose transport system permease protein